MKPTLLSTGISTNATKINECITIRHNRVAAICLHHQIIQRGRMFGATENARPGKCRTWKMTDQVAGLEMQDQIILPLVEHPYVLIH